MKFKIEEVKFFGGEPLLMKKDIEYIINNIPLKEVDYFITTNATLIDDRFMDFAKEHDIKLTFSIDGDKNTTSLNRKESGKKEVYDIVLKNTIQYSPFIRINMVITSTTAKYMVENFNFLYAHGVRNFNFLPEYWSNWTKEGLKDLALGFKEILELYSNGKKFSLINIENYQELPFFNLGIIIDTDGKIYGTNHILSGHFGKHKKELEIGDVFNGLKFDISDRGFAQQYIKKLDFINHTNYSSSIIRSVEYIDSILNNFVNNFQNLK
ncbi:MAG: hypothetical protein PHQ95_04065 [Candidatus Gracilibacteria bacterium]|nr:hypothetical protein [Candidatus Gracilibacteria bacterium]